LDGPEVCEQLKVTDPAYPFIPLTVTTALVEPPGLEIVPAGVVTLRVNVDRVTVTFAELLTD
jgi:hypothetical protein